MKLFNICCALTTFLTLGIHFGVSAQDDGCDKCSMLREEYETAVSPRKEEVYAFFKSECLDTQTEFVNNNGSIADSSVADKIRVVSKGKCIDYTEVREVDKNTQREIASYQVIKKDTIYLFASRFPSFPGGDKALFRYLSANIKYPSEARSKQISGTVYVKLTIRKNGVVDQVKAIRSPSALLSEEAIRIVKTMPAWNPGEHEGKKVSMVHYIPVRFALR